MIMQIDIILCWVCCSEDKKGWFYMLGVFGWGFEYDAGSQTERPGKYATQTKQKKIKLETRREIDKQSTCMLWLSKSFIEVPHQKLPNYCLFSGVVDKLRQVEFQNSIFGASLSAILGDNLFQNRQNHYVRIPTRTYTTTCYTPYRYRR